MTDAVEVVITEREVVEVNLGVKGDSGVGLPDGGTTGQIARKASDDDYDVEWFTLSIDWTDVTGKPTFAAIATSGSASDLSAGTLPAARFDDTAHGSRGGGALHANAVAAGAAGFMTGADKAKLDAITGTNTGDQTITLTGDVTGSGTGSFAATIANLAVTSAKIADDAVGNDKLANMAVGTIKARVTAGTGNPENASGTQVTALLDTFTSGLKGLVPPSGGGTTNFLRADGTFAAPPGGGGGSPGGSSGEVQFNNAGAFGASADFTFDDSTNRLALAGTDTSIDLTGITTEPAAPAAGVLRTYSKSIAGRMVLKARGPSGLDTPLQAALWGNNIVMWTPTSAAGGLWIGTAGTSAGAFANTLPTDTSLSTGIKRARYSNVVTTANQVLGQRSNDQMFFRGNGVPGAGGFFFFARMTFETWTNGGRFFAGMSNTTNSVANNPSTPNHTVGFCIDDTDAGAISFMTRGGSTTKAPTGFTAASGSGYDLYFFCAPGSSQYSWRIVEINTGTEASGVATANLPTNTTKHWAGVLASNAALTAANDIQIAINRIYVETDY